jgi:serine/threonine protein kinase/tetratricopeptide (TPR) repeat protein
MRRPFSLIDQTVSHYKVLEEIGRGGMGIVYKGQDLKLDRLVALKFLHPEYYRSKDEKELLVQEAKAASTLDHPNICTIYEIDEAETGQLFFAMAFYEGETLKSLIEKTRINIDNALQIIIQITSGIANAHKKGLVHRDIKPANIIITKEGVAKIMDFGIARLSGQDDAKKKRDISGTLSYMAPEQITGDPIDHRTDLWQLGVTLFEMLTSELPFSGEFEEVLIYSILNEAPISSLEIRFDLPPELEKIILKCLKKNKTERYESADQLLADLQSLVLSLEELKKLTSKAETESVRKMREAERRHATIIFSEIGLGGNKEESVDAEEWAVVTKKCIELISTVARSVGGTVDKIVGNTISILFGIPSAIEKSSIKAVEAALKMRNKIHKFSISSSTGFVPELKTGINTGMVIAEEVESEGKRDFSVFGELVTFVANLKEQSEFGKILIGPGTYKETRKYFHYETAGSISVKSTDEAVPIYELITEDKEQFTSESGFERSIQSKLVGRDKELSDLESQIHNVIKNKGSIVNIIGEAGIGKSRLIAELMNLDIMKQVTVIEGRSISIGQNLSFHPIIDLLKNWADINENDTEPVALKKLEDAVRKVYAQDFNEVIPFILTMLGIKFSNKEYEERIKNIEGEALQKLIMKSVRELFGKISDQNPLIVICEDLHWADKSSIELLGFLFRLTETNRIIFINVFRPGYPDTSDFIIEIIKDRYPNRCINISLAPLDESKSEILINNLLHIKDFPTDLRNKIIRRAGGNPFFIEEVFRTFIDHGAIVLKHNSYRVTEKMNEVVIPETINDILMARIDLLDENTRNLLKLASVIGRSFFYSIINEVAKSVDDIDNRLRFLEEIQLIRERKRLEELEYLFKHALVQEATYESILVKNRRDLHLKVADTIEKVFKERLHEFYGMLAFHYNKGENLDKAEEYLIQAGKEALKSSASNEALHYYKQALSLYLKKHVDNTSPDKIAMLEKNIATALYNRGRYVEAAKYFTDVLAYYGERKAKHILWEVIRVINDFLILVLSLYFPSFKFKKTADDRINEIMNLAHKKCISLAIPDPKRFFIESLHSLRKLTSYILKKIENGVEIFMGGSVLFCWPGISFTLSQKILGYCEDKVDRSNAKSRIIYEFTAFLHDFLKGDWKSTREFDTDLIDENLKIGEIFFPSSYLAFQGRMRIELGNFSEVEKNIRMLQYIGDTFEHDYAKTYQHLLSMKLYLKFGKFSQALNESSNGIGYVQKTDFRTLLFVFWAYRARIQIFLGDIQSAEESIQTAEKIKAEINLVPIYVNCFLITKFYYYLDRIENSDKQAGPQLSQSYSELLRIIKQTVKLSRYVASDRTEVYHLSGIYYWLRGNQKQAMKLWQKSISFGQYCGARIELAHTFLTIGKSISNAKEKSRKIRNLAPAYYFKQAKNLIDSFDSDWDLEQLRKAGYTIESN